MDKAMWSRLPQEIIVNILSFLPVKSILRFRCVCKPWYNLLTTDPNFVKKHLNHAIAQNKFNLLLHGYPSYSIDYDDVLSSSSSSSSSRTCFVKASKIDFPINWRVYRGMILGSCDGLICVPLDFQSMYEGGIYIWNPSTREYIDMPSPTGAQTMYNYECDGVSEASSFGFGYDCKLDNYKLVHIESVRAVDASQSFRVPLRKESFQVEVWVMGSYHWRSIPSNSYFLSNERSGVLFNGALHWIAILTCRGASKSIRFILCFDIADEKFQEMQLPHCWDDKFITEVGVLKGSLSALGTLYEDRIDVWVMKEHGVIESWTKLFTISQQTCIKSLRLTQSSRLRFILPLKNGEFLFELHSDEKDKKFLVSYDPKHERASILKVQERTNILKRRTLAKWFDIGTYVESMVSLRSRTYGR